MEILIEINDSGGGNCRPPGSKDVSGDGNTGERVEALGSPNGLSSRLAADTAEDEDRKNVGYHIGLAEALDEVELAGEERIGNGGHEGQTNCSAGCYAARRDA